MIQTWMVKINPYAPSPIPGIEVFGQHIATHIHPDNNMPPWISYCKGGIIIDRESDPVKLRCLNEQTHFGPQDFQLDPSLRISFDDLWAIITLQVYWAFDLQDRRSDSKPNVSEVILQTIDRLLPSNSFIHFQDYGRSLMLLPQFICSENHREEKVCRIAVDLVSFEEPPPYWRSVVEIQAMNTIMSGLTSLHAKANEDIKERVRSWLGY